MQNFFNRTPIAWLQLVHQKTKLLAAIAGITFAVVLMFMQFGFQDALYSSATLVHQKLQGDLFLINTQSENIIASKQFSRRVLYQAMNHSGVKDVTPIYVGLTHWKNPWTGKERALMVLGFEPRKPLLKLVGITENLSQLNLSDTVLFDRLSRAEFGPVANHIDQGEKVSAEVNHRRVDVKGIFSLGASFGADGNLITSDLNFLRIFSDRRPEAIDIGVLQLDSNANILEIKNELSATLKSQVRVLTKEEFIAFEKHYWEDSSAIGFIFSLGVLMGFIVGVVISYQILYSDVVSHMPEYATLKAMGYTNWYLTGIVFQESLLLSIFGYAPGLLISAWLFQRTQTVTNLPMQMTFLRTIMVLILTIIMCFISGLIAMRKLRQVDPAEIF